MARRNGKQAASSKITVNVGDFVLLGGTRASYPNDWFLGEVLHNDRGYLFVARSTLNGDRWHQIASIGDVRARGSIDELVRVQEAARKEVQQLRAEIAACEQALGAARDRLFNRLDELAAGGMPIIPPDFDAIEAGEKELRAVIERGDDEDAARRVPAESAA